MKRGTLNRRNKNIYRFISASLCLCVLILLSAACNELEKPKTEPFYAQTAPPPKQEFRWSNGKMPKSFDPALASAPPESDIVRAVYEGLTDTEAKTLETVPAIAARWTASEDFKTWTFYLRKDAKWSNGESVTAHDFVRSWQRLASLGEKISQRKLLKNIVGLDTENVLPVFASEEIDSFSASSNANAARFSAAAPGAQSASSSSSSSNVNVKGDAAPKEKIGADEPKPETAKNEAEPEPKPAQREQKSGKAEIKFGVEAIDDFTLKVSLARADKNFPALVAHPIFRPVFGEGGEFESDAGGLNAAIVTNGAFRISSVGADGVTLDRADYYWGREQVGLERVRFVPAENAESALEDYRAGRVDAVTNANFAPLALKLLTPFDDFRRTKHSAVNFYEFNQYNAPFDDRRVREALTISVERERLTEDEMDGATVPALSYLPFGEPKIQQNAERAKNLLAEAGFPNGENFPSVRLLINRNDLQRRIARSVAKMWEKNLGVKTEIIVKEGEDFETAARNGEYDVIRRGVVLPTTDETTNMLTMFGAFSSENSAASSAAAAAVNNSEATRGESERRTAENESAPVDNAPPQAGKKAEANSPPPTETGADAKPKPSAETEEQKIMTEERALAELPAIPLYFPASYALVRPYVHGFETNVLDAPSLKSVRIDNNWQPPAERRKSKQQPPPPID